MRKSYIYNLCSFFAFFFIPLGAVFTDSLSFPISPHVPLFVLLTVVLVGQAVARNNIPRLDRPVMFFLLSIVVLLPVAMQSINIDGIIDSYRRQLELLLPYFVLLLSTLVYNRSAIISLKGYVLGSLVSAIYAFSLFFSGEVYFAGRLTVSELYNPTAFGAHLAASIIFALWLNEKREINSIALLAIVGPLVIALFMSQSRNAILGVALAVCAFLFMRIIISISAARRNGEIEKTFVASIFKTLLIVIVFSIVLAFFFSSADLDEKFYSRILATFEGNDAAAATGNRSWIWQNYIETEFPIFGLGFNNTASLIFQAGQEHFPHNAFLLAYVQGGIVFMFLYVAFLYLLIDHGLPRAKGRPSSLFMIAFFLIIISFGNDVYQYIYFWVPCAFYIILVRQEDQRII